LRLYTKPLKKNEKYKRPFVPYLPVYKGEPGDISYIRSRKYLYDKTFRGYQLISTDPKRKFLKDEEILVNYYPTIYPYELQTLEKLQRPLIERCITFLKDNVANRIEDEIYYNSDEFSMTILNFILDNDSIDDLIKDIGNEVYNEIKSVQKQQEVIIVDSASDDENNNNNNNNNNKTLSPAELKVQKLKKQLATAQEQLLKTQNKKNNNNNDNNSNKNKKRKNNKSNQLCIDLDQDIEQSNNNNKSNKKSKNSDTSGTLISSSVNPISVFAKTVLLDSINAIPISTGLYVVPTTIDTSNIFDTFPTLPDEITPSVVQLTKEEMRTARLEFLKKRRISEALEI
jgi:hypothetical protein